MLLISFTTLFNKVLLRHARLFLFSLMEIGSIAHKPNITPAISLAQ